MKKTETKKRPVGRPAGTAKFTEKFMLRLTPEIHDNIRADAERLEISMSRVVYDILKEHYIGKE